MITKDHIRQTAEVYLQENPQEADALAPLFELLEQDAELTSRKEFRGHVTAGAILTDREGRVLFIRHVALGRWLTPGGHLEAEDERLSDSALRELTEETGIQAHHVVPLLDVPVHIDVHPIPASEAKGEPEHRHIDFRYLFTTDQDVVELQTEEVSGAQWREVETLGDAGMRERVRQVLQVRA
ncbi:NUDIX hydrolase [Streptomyces sp. NPDC093591]|uniref:NUDIX hydrolase n=1 Tax=Streptomyces sp. NPDC093591 TaxID=3366044 RepID=UPI0038264B5E